MQAIASLRPGQRTAVLGEIKSAHLATTRRRGFRIFHAVLGDTSGAIRCTWMNQAFLADILTPHLQLVVFGDVKLDSSGLHFLNPEYEIVAADSGETLGGVHTGRIVPFYEKTGTVTPNMQRRLVRQALDLLPQEIPDALPQELRARAGLAARRPALEAAHFPPNEESIEALNAFRTPAQRRLIFEEFFLYQLGHAWRRHAGSVELKPWVPKVDDRIRASAAAVLPFKLTPGQKGALKEIVDDMLRAATDAPPSAGRRWRREDDRGVDCGDRRYGERPPGGLHGANGDPGGAALQQYRPPAGVLPVPCGHADGPHSRSSQTHAAVSHRARHDAPGRRHACAGGGQDQVPPARSWWSSTSSIVLASRNAPPCGRKACVPTCCS
jgi:hypothetical protein